MRPSRPISQAPITLSVEVVHPPVGSLAGHTHRFGDMRHRHPLHTNPIHKKPAPMNSQSSVNVTHADLQWVEDSNLRSEVCTYPRTVNNVPTVYT